MKSLPQMNAAWWWATIRSRITLSLAVIVLICLEILLLVWWFGLFESRLLSILVTVLVGYVMVSELRSKPRPWRARGELAWFCATTTTASTLLAGVHYDWGILASSGAVIISALPLWWLSWQIMRRRRLLFSGMGLALGVMMLYWAVGLYRTGASLELLLLPLPAIMLVSVAWAGIGWVILHYAEERKNRWVTGPGMQAAAMAYLFLPSAVVAVVMPQLLKLGDAWSAVSLTLLGVLLSAVIAEPLRRFLLEWGNLAPGLGRPLSTSMPRLRLRLGWRQNMRLRRLVHEAIPFGVVLIIVAAVVTALVVIQIRRSVVDEVLGFVLDDSGGVVIADYNRLARARVSAPYDKYLQADFIGSPVRYEPIGVQARQVAGTAVVYDRMGEPAFEILKGQFRFNGIRLELDEGLGCRMDPYREYEFWNCPGPKYSAVALFPETGHVILASRAREDLRELVKYLDLDPTKLASVDDGRFKRILDRLPGGFLSVVFSPGSCVTIEGCEGFGFTVRNGDGETLAISYALVFDSPGSAASAQAANASSWLLQRAVANLDLELHAGESKRDGTFIVGTYAAEFNEGVRLTDGKDGSVGDPGSTEAPQER